MNASPEQNVQLHKELTSSEKQMLQELVARVNREFQEKGDQVALDADQERWLKTITGGDSELSAQVHKAVKSLAEWPQNRDPQKLVEAESYLSGAPEETG